MGQFLGFGNGQDGDLVISGNVTESPIDSSCSGAAGARTLVVGAGLSFAAGQIVMVHQTRGTGAGAWELAQVESYAGTTLTLVTNLDNTYTDDGGDSQAQVRVVKQYRSVTIQAGSIYSPKAWDGDVGGILAFLCSGVLTKETTGLISASGKGYRGGPSAGTNEGTSGEGYPRYGLFQEEQANGNGGGGGLSRAPGALGSGGGGGGLSTDGTHGGPGDGVGGGEGGYTTGVVALTTLFLGGGGGSGSGDRSGLSGGSGGNGGGIVLIFTRYISLATAQSIISNGEAGNNGGSGGGGGGAGGSVLIKTSSAILGTSLIITIAGAGGSGGGGAVGGAGGAGRIRIEACDRTGTTNPAASEAIGGNNWCVTGGSIY